MVDATCSSCGSTFEQAGRGRPRKYCEGCRPPRIGRVRPAKEPRVGSCVECGAEFETFVSKRKFCSDRCRWMERRVPCAACGEPLHLGSSSRPAGEAVHRRCMTHTPDGELIHGVMAYKKRGCRCDVCTAEASDAVRQWTRKNNYWAKPDVVARRRSQRSTPEGRAKEREQYRRYYEANRAIEIRRAADRWAKRKGAPTVPFTRDQLEARLSMFAGCWMCGAGLDELHIDHVKPLSRGGWHCLSNLRPACPACNLSKGAKWPLHNLAPMLSA